MAFTGSSTDGYENSRDLIGILGEKQIDLPFSAAAGAKKPSGS